MSNNGLSTGRRNGGSNIYLKVMNGKLVQTVKEGTPNSVQRLNKNNETVFELLFTGLTARITNIALIDGKFGKELEVKAKTGEQAFVIQTPSSGGYAYGFFTRMTNLDFEKDTEIVPYAIEDKNTGKTNHVIVLYQDGKKVEPAFTKDAPNGLPPLETIKGADGKEVLKNNKPIWDDSKRIEFFSDIVYGTGGVNETLIALYGTPEEVAAGEDKEDFLDDTTAPTEATEENGQGITTAKAGEVNPLSSEFEKEADQQKATAISANNADQVAANDTANAGKTKKAAAKKAAKK